MKLQPYPEYKDSGVPWLGRIPVHWENYKLRNMLTPVSMRSRPDLPLLSVVREKGVIKRDVSSKQDNHNFIPDDLSNYKVVLKGQFAMNKMKAWQGSYGVSNFDGIVSPAYFVFDLSVVDGNFFHVAIRSSVYVPFFTQASDGVRVGQWDLNRARMKEISFLVPSSDEQTQIARFLDWKTAQINKFIRNKRRLVELLREQKRNIINQAVTRGLPAEASAQAGLDPDVKFKPSGVEWIGDIPRHWEVRKLKHIAAMKSGDNLTSNQIVETGEYPVYGGNSLRGYFNDYNKDGRYLLVGRQGALCGNVHRVNGKFWATEHAVVTEVRPGISTDWYYYMLTVMNLNQYSESAAQPGVSVEKIQNLWTALPSFVEQESIVSHIEQETTTIDQTITRAQREIELMREYRTRLISDVVTGQVDVRGSDLPAEASVRAGASEVAEEVLPGPDEDSTEADDVTAEESEAEVGE